MSYGLSVFNGSGALIFDSNNNDHIPYQIFASGTTSSVSGASANDFRSVFVTVNGFDSSKDILFIRPTGNPDGVSAYTSVGVNSFIIYSDTNTSFYYYIFRPSNELFGPTSEYGLQVFNENGQQIFNSDLLMARVKGRLEGSGAFINGSNLYSTANLKYTSITTDVFPRRGLIRGYVSKWGSSSVTLIDTDLSPFGPSVSLAPNSNGSAVPELIWDLGFYADLASPVTLVITAPDP